MKTKFADYLNSIGMSTTFINRADEVYEFYYKIFPERLADIFISEYLKDDGTREYESLWLFTENHTMEAKNFLTEDDFDIAPIKKGIKHIEVKKNEYNFVTATIKSRLNIHFITEMNIAGELKASKENCENLKDIFLKYFVTNLTS